MYLSPRKTLMSLLAGVRRRDLDAGLIVPPARTGVSGGSMVGVVGIWVTFPSADPLFVASGAL
jgi:hypothetical protein